MLNDLKFERKKDFFTTYSSPNPNPSYNTSPNTNLQSTFPQNSDPLKPLYDHINKIYSEIDIIKRKINNLEYSFPQKGNKNNQNNLNNLTKDDIIKLIQSEIIKNQSKIEEKNSKMEKDISQIDSVNQKNLNIINSLTEKIDEMSTCMININKNYSYLLNNNQNQNKKLLLDEQINYDKVNIEMININKKINGFDKDFDRLIDSLKTQFKDVNDNILLIDNNKINKGDIYNIINDCLNKNSYQNTRNDNKEQYNNNYSDFNTFNPNKLANNTINTSSRLNNNNDTDNFNNTSRNKKIQPIYPSNNEYVNNNNTMNNIPNKNYLRSKSVKHSLKNLQTQLNSNFEKINQKILTELQNQSEDINELYSQINQLNKLIINPNQKSTDETIMNKNINDNKNNNNSMINNINEILNEKVNINELNYALEAQAKINDALCSANKIGRWSWKENGILNDKGFIIWNIQNINTSLDIFNWKNNSDVVSINGKGIYCITAGLIFSNKMNFGNNVDGVNKDNCMIFININNQNLYYNSNNVNDGEDDLILISKFVVVNDVGCVQIGIVTDNNNNNYLSNYDSNNDNDNSHINSTINNSNVANKYYNDGKMNNGFNGEKCEAFLEIKKII